MTTFGYYHQDLELNVKYRVLSVEQCQEFAIKYEDLPKNEYITNVLNMCIANIHSEVRPALLKLNPLQADNVLTMMYNGSIMLNPVLDIPSWTGMMAAYDVFHHAAPAPTVTSSPPALPEQMSAWNTGWNAAQAGLDAGAAEEEEAKKKEVKRIFGLTKAKLRSMPKWLKTKIIGQDEPIDMIHKAILRHQVGLGDGERPVGIFLCCGPSGVGKTLLAKELQKYLFDENSDIARLNCGEFQQKHENQKLLGSPPGYTGHDDGGQLLKIMKDRQNGTVFLLDEVEKAHPEFWNTFLSAFDDGYVIDAKGNRIDFTKTIFIMTSNLGNKKVSEDAYGKGAGFTAASITNQYDSKEAPKRALVERITLEAVRKYFSPEFYNRLDEVIVFNHLTPTDFCKIADLQFNVIEKKLQGLDYSMVWSQEARELLVSRSSKSMEGARSMERVRRTSVEDMLASLMDRTKFPEGKVFKLDVEDGEFKIA